MADLLSIALSGLTANRTALSTTGNNITNANTPGYSRESTSLNSSDPAYVGGAFQGTGVSVSGVVRQANNFLTSQLRSDTAQFNQVDSFLTAITRINGYIANSTTSVSTNVQGFFTSLQGALNAPSSVTSRQVVLSSMQSLVNSFNATSSQIDNENQTVNGALTADIQQINGIAQNIASLNNQLAGTGTLSPAQQPNELLDKRDEQIRQLSELVSVTVVPTGDGTVNVFIGNGQSLVNGAGVSTLITQPSHQNSRQLDIAISGVNGPQVVTSTITGGKVGGLLNYQSSVLDFAQNSIGQMATILADNMNKQNKLGVDLTGTPGINLFSDINASTPAAQRIIADSSNPTPQTYNASVTISNSAQLTASDYVLTFPGPSKNNYVLTRKTDSAVVAQGQLPGGFPASINADGFSINLTSGNFVTGSKFYIQPTKTAAGGLALNITTPQQLALAWPVTTSTSAGNRGTGTISVAGIQSIATPSFATTSGKLTPPLIVRFTSATTYDVLDNTDPSKPVSLNPPLINQVFAPNSNNQMLSSDSGATQVSSTGAAAGKVVAGAANGYPAETLTFNIYNPTTKTVSTSTVSTVAGQSAQQIAQSINALNGVKAVADSQAVLGSFVNSGTLALTLNGQALSGTTPDALAASINGSALLAQQGIFALSDGTNLTVRSTSGADLKFQNKGGAADSVKVTDRNGGNLTVTGGNAATVGGILNIQLPGSSSMVTTGAGLFVASPPPQSLFRGYTLQMNGAPVAGDSFLVSYNSNGTGDARNGQLLAAVQTANLANNGAMSITDVYGNVVEQIGTLTNTAKNNQASASTVMNNTTKMQSQVSGVNLDEEASKLIQFQQAYSASAQVINTARTLFNSLLQAVSA